MMIFNLKPEWVEPSFSIYYLDIVYSYPAILEVDFLSIFKGALLSVEVENEPTNIPRKSLKYFVNGVCRYPVVYFSINSSSDKDETESDTKWVRESGITIPTLVDCQTMKEQLRNFLENNRSTIIQKKNERSQLFTIDNFLCALLVYSSPLICDILLMKSSILEHVLNSFEVAGFRASLIKKAKLLEKRDDGWRSNNGGTCNPSIENQAKEKFQSIRSIIMIIPIVRSMYFHTELKRFIEEKGDIKCLFPNLEKLVFVYTKESCEDAKTIISVVMGKNRNDIQTDKREVNKNEIGEIVKNLAAYELPKDVLILTIGEVPKSELIKFIDPILNTRLGILLWRLNVYKEKLEKFIEEALNCKKVSDVGGIEKIELQLLEI
ncbi:MAG: hypothetical protein QXF28_07335 [Nitrososphaerota archaeon]